MRRKNFHSWQRNGNYSCSITKIFIMFQVRHWYLPGKIVEKTRKWKFQNWATSWRTSHRKNENDIQALSKIAHCADFERALNSYNPASNWGKNWTTSKKVEKFSKQKLQIRIHREKNVTGHIHASSQMTYWDITADYTKVQKVFPERSQ